VCPTVQSLVLATAVDKWRVHAARADGVAADAARHEVGRHRIRHCEDRALARRVREAINKPNARRNRGQIDNGTTLAVGQHVAHTRLQAVKDTLHVDRKDAVELGVVAMQHISHRRDARVVDEHIDAAARHRCDCFECGIDGCRIAHVANVSSAGLSMGFRVDLLDRSIKRLRRHVDESYGRSRLGEYIGNGKADTRGSLARIHRHSGTAFCIRSGLGRQWHTPVTMAVLPASEKGIVDSNDPSGT